MKISASIVMSVKNVEKTIGPCISSLLDQTFSDFEVIIVDDVSCDDTRAIIEEFNDKRVKYFRNQDWLGLSQSRNKSISLAKGEYIFFTDGDCCVHKRWLEQGIHWLKTKNCVGVEGKTYYVSEEYVPTRSDAIVENMHGGLFLTCNIAYKQSILKQIGGFDERFTYLEDRDLAFRAIRYGKVLFNPQMVVYHQKKTSGLSQFLQSSKRLRNRVLLYKKFGEKPSSFGRVFYPMDVAKLIFPPLIFGSLLCNKYKSKEDINLFPYIYVRLVMERLDFWHMCARERVFLV